MLAVSRDALERDKMNMSSTHMANAVSRRVRLRAEVLEETADTFRCLPYSALRDMADRPHTRIVVGRDGTKHQLRVRVQRKQPGSKDVEVTVTLLGDGRWQPELIEHFVRKFHEWPARSPSV